MTHPSFMTLSNPWLGKYLLLQWSASSHSAVPLRCWAMMMLIFHSASFSCQIYQAVICLAGWLPTLSEQLIWLYPKGPPAQSPAGASWKWVCVTGWESSLLEPELWVNTSAFCRVPAGARHELGMTSPSKVPGEFNWRPAPILSSYSSVFFKLCCETKPIHLPDLNRGVGWGAGGECFQVYGPPISLFKPLVPLV